MSIWIWFRYCFGVAFVGGVVYMIWTISNQMSKMCQVIRNEYTQSRKHENVTSQLVKQINQLIDATLDDDDDDECPPLLRTPIQPDYSQPVVEPVHVPAPVSESESESEYVSVPVTEYVSVPVTESEYVSVSVAATEPTPGNHSTTILEEIGSGSDSDSSGWDIDSGYAQEEPSQELFYQLLQQQQTMARAFEEQRMHFQQPMMTELIPESDGEPFNLDLEENVIAIEDIDVTTSEVDVDNMVEVIAIEDVDDEITQLEDIKADFIEDVIEDITGELIEDVIEDIKADVIEDVIEDIKADVIEDVVQDVDNVAPVVSEEPFTVTQKSNESEGWMKLTKKEMQTLVAQKGLHTAPSRLNRTELVAILTNTGPI